MGHSHNAFLDACDYNSATNTCAMDGADKVGCSGPGCPTSNPAYQYVQASDVQPYFTMAETYAFGDRMFQTNEGPSFPAHQYILSGTSRIAAASNTAVADNPANNNAMAGCLAPPGSTEDAIDISQASPKTQLTTLTFPLCFEHATLTDLLDTASFSVEVLRTIGGLDLDRAGCDPAHVPTLFRRRKLRRYRVQRTGLDQLQP